MSTVRQIIESARKDVDLDLIAKSDAELDLLENSEGINEQNNLEQFYNVWQKHKDETGDRNDINSWTAYLIGMTKAKPDGDFLPVRRAFARAGFPDIDTDFDDVHRQNIYDYLIKRYGRDNVGNIGTYGALKTKSCLTRLIKALDLANAFHKGRGAFVTENKAIVDEILESFPKSLIAGKMQVRDSSGDNQPIKSVKDAYRLLPKFKYYADKHPGLLKYSRHLEGVISNFSVHASGVCISDIPLSSIAPLRFARKGDRATQWTYEDLETLGLIKFDILAIATLTVIKKTVDLIQQNYNIAIDIENLPLDDQPTINLYRSGRLAGVFQCESYPMQKVMQDIDVDKFDDVMAAISLFRPGPMDSIPDYCARKSGSQQISYFHSTIEPYVKPYLERTYGLLVYQEQVMQICNVLAGFSVTDGYVVIKGIGKKKAHIINKFKKQFITGCIDKKVPEDVAEQYWEKFITPFAAYGFNAAHSAAYGYNSWITAYLKANYPDEFVCAFCNTEIMRGKHEKVEMMEKDAKNSLNIKILPKSVNDCDIEYKIFRKKDSNSGTRQTEIRPSMICKGIGQSSAQNVVDNQPYKDIKDFATKTDTRIVDTDVLGALIDNGFFKGKKGIGMRGEIIEKFSIIRQDLKKRRKDGTAGAGDLFE